MEHRSYTEIERLGRIIRPPNFSRRERLLLWAFALEKRRGTRLRTLQAIERKPHGEYILSRAENSPLSVAFADPVLRSAGLTGDSVGEAARFFSLSHWQLHELVCHCNFGETVAAEAVALRVRRLANQIISLVAAIALLMSMLASALLLASALRLLIP
jgi:hypothetical protein